MTSEVPRAGALEHVHYVPYVHQAVARLLLAAHPHRLTQDPARAWSAPAQPGRLSGLPGVAEALGLEGGGR